MLLTLIAFGSKLQSLSSGELWSHVLTMRNQWQITLRSITIVGKLYEHYYQKSSSCMYLSLDILFLIPQAAGYVDIALRSVVVYIVTFERRT